MCVGKCLLVATVLTLLSSYFHHSLGKTPEEALMQWALAEGAETRVTIGPNASGVRGLILIEDVKKGDVLLNIPAHIIFSVKNAPAAETAPQLLREIHSGCSRLAPYLAVLPKSHEVLTAYNWPEEYIPYLANDALITCACPPDGQESQVLQSFKRHSQDVWSGKLDENQEVTLKEAVGMTAVSLPEFQLVVSVLTSRTFQTRRAALSMVPIADMANHHPDGINEIADRQFNDSNFRFVAGRDLKKGEELTISYGTMRNDDLLLYYGFVDETTWPPRLCAIDHRNYTLFESDSDTLSNEDLEGPLPEVEEEMIRLQEVLKDYDAKIKALAPIPTTNAYLASVLARFHYLRREALVHEINRLERLLGEL